MKSSHRELLALLAMMQFGPGVDEEDIRYAKEQIATAIGKIQEAEECLNNIYPTHLRHEGKKDFNVLFQGVKNLLSKYKSKQK